MIRVILPVNLRILAHIQHEEIQLDVPEPVTQRNILTAIEEEFPALIGTIRDYSRQERRPFLRFFVCGEDWSHESPDQLLPADIRSGKEPFLIIGAIAGG